MFVGCYTAGVRHLVDMQSKLKLEKLQKWPINYSVEECKRRTVDTRSAEIAK